MQAVPSPHPAQQARDQGVMTEFGKTTIKIVSKPVPREGMAMVVLMRVNPLGILPDHCIHGQASCWACGHMCYLGSESEKKVSAGVWFPVCKECADIIMPGSGAVAVRNANDHKRKDGPHE